MTRDEDAVPAERQEDVWELDTMSNDAKQPFVTTTATSVDKGEPITSVGDLFVALGNPGKMAVAMFFAVSFNFFSITTNHVIGVFLGYIPEYECHPNQSSFQHGQIYSDGSSNHSSLLSNLTPNQSTEFSSYVTYSACSATIRNASGTNNFTHKCGPGEWQYKVDSGESSSVTEWDLVCEDTYLANLANTFYYIGVTIGGLCVAYVSDTIGRKVALLLCLYSVAILGVGLVFCQNFLLFICLRTLMGLSAQVLRHTRISYLSTSPRPYPAHMIQALMTTSFIMVVEMFPPAHRGKAGTGCQSLWGLSMVYLSLAAWGLKDWRHIQLACTVPAIVSGIYLLWMPESLRWLLSRGKTEKAHRVVKQIYRFNGCTNEKCLDTHILHSLTTCRKYEQQTFFDLCRSPILRKNTIIFAHVVCAINLGYWGITYNTSMLVGNRYLNFLLGAIAELIILTLNIFIIDRFGRKWPLISYLLIGSVCCVMLALLPTGTNVMVFTAISTFGRLCMAGCFSAGDLYAAELFPTVIRATGVSICVLTGRLGAMLTPQIFTLGEYTFKEISLLIFGGTTLAGALLTMFLPDTSQMELADTVTEAEKNANLLRQSKKGGITQGKNIVTVCEHKGEEL